MEQVNIKNINDKIKDLIKISLETKLNIDQLIFCFLILNNEKNLLEKYVINVKTFDNKDIDYLKEKGFITIKDNNYIFENIKVTDKFKEIFNFYEKTAESWIDEWFDLFPEGIKSGGYYVKTDKKSCLKKMNKFLKIYPEYDKDIIIKATKNYIDNLRLKNFSHIKLAPYFIEKDNISMLEGCCRNLLNNMNNKNFNNNDSSGSLVIDI